MASLENTLRQEKKALSEKLRPIERMETQFKQMQNGFQRLLTEERSARLAAEEALRKGLDARVDARLEQLNSTLNHFMSSSAASTSSAAASFEHAIAEVKTRINKLAEKASAAEKEASSASANASQSAVNAAKNEVEKESKKLIAKMEKSVEARLAKESKQIQTAAIAAATSAAASAAPSPAMQQALSSAHKAALDASARAAAAEAHVSASDARFAQLVDSINQWKREAAQAQRASDQRMENAMQHILANARLQQQQQQQQQTPQQQAQFTSPLQGGASSLHSVFGVSSPAKGWNSSAGGASVSSSSPYASFDSVDATGPAGLRLAATRPVWATSTTPAPICFWAEETMMSCPQRQRERKGYRLSSACFRHPLGDSSSRIVASPRHSNNNSSNSDSAAGRFWASVRCATRA